MKLYLTVAVGSSPSDARPLFASTNHAVIMAAIDAILSIAQGVGRTTGRALAPTSPTTP